jgi:SAM-dependent methyltransferase
MTIEDYTKRHAHLLSTDLPPLLRETLEHRTLGHVIDLGAGDGALLWAARGQYDAATAVDLSSGRIERIQRTIPEVRALVADACNTGLPSESASSILCSQVIEHVPDDTTLAAEIRRLLSEDGWFYVGSVLRARRAFWVYRRAGCWWLDPTHVREYPSTERFKSALQAGGLRVDELRVSPFRFPFLDMVLRAAAATRLVAQTSAGSFYVRRPWAQRLRRATFQPPGYFLIEAVGTRQSD